MPRRCDLRPGNALGIILFLLALLVSAPARADQGGQGPPAEAKKAFADGKAAYERGDYDLALQLFQRALVIAPAPSLYYNMGMAYERLKRYEDAAIAFEKYLQLIDAPANDEERSFQAKLRERAATDRSLAHQAGTTTAPAPLVEPPPVAADPRYPRYVYPSAPAVAMAPQLTHQQKIDNARRHRNNGIALTIIGSILTVTGIGVTAWGAVDESIAWGPRAGIIVGGTILFVPGIALLIPGAVAFGKWQKELNAELKRPDDGAAAQRAALDLAAPPPTLQQGREAGRFVLATPAIRF